MLHISPRNLPHTLEFLKESRAIMMQGSVSDTINTILELTAERRYQHPRTIAASLNKIPLLVLINLFAATSTFMSNASIWYNHCMETTHTHSNIVLRCPVYLNWQQMSASPNVGICMPKKNFKIKDKF